MSMLVLMVADVAGAITNGRVFRVVKHDGVSYVKEKEVDLRDE